MGILEAAAATLLTWEGRVDLLLAATVVVAVVAAAGLDAVEELEWRGGALREGDSVGDSDWGTLISC